VILTEDALVDVSRGRVPVVLDAYALALIDKNHPELVTPLVGRIEQKEFAYIVLQYRLDLDPNEILRIVESSPVHFISCREPLWADQHQHHVAGVDLILNLLNEVLPWRNATFDVHK